MERDGCLREDGAGIEKNYATGVRSLMGLMIPAHVAAGINVQVRELEGVHPPRSVTTGSQICVNQMLKWRWKNERYWNQNEGEL